VVRIEYEEDPREVLIVDDQISVVQSIYQSLRREQMKVHTLTDSRNVIAYLQNNIGISTILVDVDMPYINGVELTRMIGDNFPTRDIRVKFMSEMSSKEMYNSLGVKVDDHLTKPVGLKDVTKFLREDQIDAQSKTIIDRVRQLDFM
jgi:PleD family two-component response regulator